MRIDKVYKIGWESYTKGENLKDNPYTIKTVNYTKWIKGYLEASKDKKAKDQRNNL